MSESTGPADQSPAPSTSPDQPAEKKTKAPKPAEKPRSPEQLERRKTIIRFAVFIGVGAVLTVLLYFLLYALIPRWWSQAVGRQVGGRISGGIVLGLMYGFIFTFLPLIVLAQARHRAFGWPAKAIIVLIAAALTAPNLMTLGIAIGNGAAARAGNRTLDVTAPGFRQATLWGVVLGALAAVIVVTFSILWERRGRELRLLQARVEELEKELPTTVPVAEQPSEPPKP